MACPAVRAMSNSLTSSEADYSGLVNFGRTSFSNGIWYLGRLDSEPQINFGYQTTGDDRGIFGEIAHYGESFAPIFSDVDIGKKGSSVGLRR